MIPIKIQCGCGQRYAFDVEPVDGRMPGAVACPVCGADGTAIADEIIRNHTPAPQPSARMRVKSSAPTVPGHVSVSHAPTPSSGTGRAITQRIGQVDRQQVEIEARAKIFWGDKREQVIQYLMVQGYTAQEASARVREMLKARAAAIRGKGIRKIAVGIGLVCIPVALFLGGLRIGYHSLKLLGIAGVFGLWGLWMGFDGLVMALSPKSERGDVADK